MNNLIGLWLMAGLALLLGSIAFSIARFLQKKNRSLRRKTSMQPIAASLGCVLGLCIGFLIYQLYLW